jgi:RNA-binding protein
MSAALTNSQIRYLKGLLHATKPVVLLGQKGLTPEVFKEIELALDHHELVKIKLAGADRDERKTMAEAIATQTGATRIALIGHMASFFRRNPKAPTLALPR